MKKGFTLIELMVVIVIMGALAAIGVPKLFGVIAKAKASEIHTAAGTYVHLQEAYLGNKPGPGNWKEIGYGAPGNGATDNFCYSQGTLESAVSIDEIPENTIGWGASNRKKLNECQAGGWWSIVITQLDGHSVNYIHNVSDGVCGSLTNSWNVGQTLTGDCAAPEVAQRDPESQSGSTQPGTKPETEEPKQDSPTTPPSKEVNLEEYYTYANGEYQKCNPSGNDNVWLTGNGATCKQLKELLIENGDLVNEKNKKGEPIDNKYEFKDKDTECLVTRRCSESPYEKVLEERKKAAEEEANGNTNQGGDNSNSGTGGVDNNQSGDNGNQNGEEGNTNQGTDVDNTNQNSSEEMICSETDKSGNCLTTRPKSECKEFKKDGSCKKWK